MLGPVGHDIFIPSIPNIAKGLNTTTNLVSVSISAIFLGNAIGTVFHGPLSDRFGRKPVILWIEGNKISNGKSILSFKNTNEEIRKLRQGFGEYDIRVSNYLIAAHEPDSVFINRILRYSWFRMQ